LLAERTTMRAQFTFPNCQRCWQSVRRCARSSPSQRLRFTMLNKLDAPRIMVLAIIECALVVSSNRRPAFRLTRFVCPNEKIETPIAAHDEHPNCPYPPGYPAGCFIYQNLHSEYRVRVTGSTDITKHNTPHKTRTGGFALRAKKEFTQSSRFAFHKNWVNTCPHGPFNCLRF
jgi:hypothetical protein